MKSVKVYKLGSGSLDNIRELDYFLNEFSKVEGPKILVHGGGKSANLINEKLGNEVVFIDGRRVTDAATLDVVTMVYAGKINKSLVAKLQNNGCNAIGLSGVDGNLIQVKKRSSSPIDYGFVGDIKGVNISFLNLLLETNIVPVICSITGNEGQLLNVNADTIAQEISSSLSKIMKVNLYYLMDKPGVLKDINEKDSVILNIDTNKIEELIESEVITSGMLPKIANAVDSKKKGVQQVFITNIENVFDLNAKKTEIL